MTMRAMDQVRISSLTSCGGEGLEWALLVAHGEGRAHLNIDPFLLRKGFVLIHEDTFCHDRGGEATSSGR